MQVHEMDILIPYKKRFRTSHAPLSYLSISHEGIFLSHILFVFVPWNEIAALVPYWKNNEGNPQYLGIVLRDEKMVRKRFIQENARNSWQRALYSFLVGVNAWLLRLGRAPSSLSIDQDSIPISIDELIMAIREKFAAELREYHIPIRDGRTEFDTYPLL